MLSAFHISYAKWAFFLTALIAALYCATLYAAGWWENVGYTLAFILVLYTGLGMRVYISSGFYGILNDISSSAASYFGIEAQVSYAEQAENHFLAVSVAMCYFAFVGCIIINGLISRKGRYYAAAIPSVLFLLVPIYLEYEPAGGYIILFAVGIITVYIFRQNRYQCHRLHPKLLQKAAQKHIFYGNFSSKAAMGTLLAVALLCSIVVSVTSFLFPRSTYMADRKTSALKMQTMDTMENFYLLGVMGLINFYPTTGGLVNGRLGGVNSVRLDYEPDLNLEFVPYTFDRIYLKTFVGAEYIPYENHWSSEGKSAYAEGWDPDTARRLKEAFASDQDNYAKGLMKITNVAAMIGVYLPYYSEDIGKTILPTKQQEYTYYPLLTGLPAGNAAPLSSDLWLDVPEANQPAIADFCEEAGLSGSQEEIIAGLRDYFQDEYPYTLSPGITPRRKDFVNYFLTEKRKGYCAHYATSAVLILRYMGIPARYVEGYAVDAADIADDAKTTDLNISDYYEGVSLIPQSSVVSYDASDADAHAWVEIYDEKLGWYPVELTPYVTDSEDGRTSIWDLFTRLFQNGQDMDFADTAFSEQTTETDKTITGGASVYRLIFCLILLFLMILVWFFVRKLLRMYHYHRANRSEKLLMKYQDMLRRVHVNVGTKTLAATGLRIRTTNPKKELYSLKSFEEQIAWLVEHGVLTGENGSAEKLLRTLNEAAYGPGEISVEAFEEALAWVRS
ncbi:MAG: transglutaminase domain-containing protein [Lachnospiraceae bacterium]|nr:transglutaminase domain-containing protein [Lachnospiraceae bacterium]